MQCCQDDRRCIGGVHTIGGTGSPAVHEAVFPVLTGIFPHCDAHQLLGFSQSICSGEPIPAPVASPIGDCGPPAPDRPVAFIGVIHGIDFVAGGIIQPDGFA